MIAPSACTIPQLLTLVRLRRYACMPHRAKSPGVASISASPPLSSPINRPNLITGLPPIGHAVTMPIHGLLYLRELNASNLTAILMMPPSEKVRNFVGTNQY